MVMHGIFLVVLTSHFQIWEKLEVVYLLCLYFILAISKSTFSYKGAKYIFTFIQMLNAVKLAVVSNFDTRLRKLLKDLKIADM